MNHGKEELNNTAFMCALGMACLANILGSYDFGSFFSDPIPISGVQTIAACLNELIH